MQVLHQLFSSNFDNLYQMWIDFKVGVDLRKYSDLFTNYISYVGTAEYLDSEMRKVSS